MRPWLLLPVLIPAAWGAITFFGYWPAPYQELLSSPLVGVGSTAIGLVIVWLADLMLSMGHNCRMPSEKEIQKVQLKKSPTGERTFVEGVTPPPAQTRSAAPPDIVQRYGNVRVPMPDDDSKTPAFPG